MLGPAGAIKICAATDSAVMHSRGWADSHSLNQRAMTCPLAWRRALLSALAALICAVLNAGPACSGRLLEAASRRVCCRAAGRGDVLPGGVRRLRGGCGPGGRDEGGGEVHVDSTTGLRIFCGTWNVNGKPPLVPLEDWLFTHSERDAVDMYVIALQEVQELSGTAALLTDEEKGRPWSALLQQAVGGCSRWQFPSLLPHAPTPHALGAPRQPALSIPLSSRANTPRPRRPASTSPGRAALDPNPAFPRAAQARRRASGVW
jgi:hypothetical protein